VERVDENLDLDSMFEMEETEKAMVYHTYAETMHLCYNFGFEVCIIFVLSIFTRIMRQTAKLILAK